MGFKGAFAVPATMAAMHDRRHRLGLPKLDKQVVDPLFNNGYTRVQWERG